MENEIHELILNGMPFNQFLVFYGFALAGSISFFLWSLYKAISNDASTPFHFEWKHMIKGAIRVILTIFILAIAIIFWDKVSMFLFTSDAPVELNGWSAVLLGVLSDRLMEVILGGGDDVRKYVNKKITA